MLSSQQRHFAQTPQGVSSQVISDLSSSSTPYTINHQPASGQTHGLLQPNNFIQWYYHRRDNVLSPGYPVLQRRDKFILAADQGLVILNANEPGWYQCRLGNQIIYSYNLIIDTSKLSSRDL